MYNKFIIYVLRFTALSHHTQAIFNLTTAVTFAHNVHRILSGVKAYSNIPVHFTKAKIQQGYV